MSAPVAKPSNRPAALHGLRVRVTFEAEVLGHYQAGPTAPELVMVKPAGGMITIVPVAHVEILK